MRLAGQGGAFDFWLEEGEDIYSVEDGEPVKRRQHHSPSLRDVYANFEKARAAMAFRRSPGQSAEVEASGSGFVARESGC